MASEKKEELISYLGEYITDHKLKLFESVLDKRTRYLTVVLENIFQPHNASAVIRSCDCFGIQDLHVIENTNEYNVNPRVALGSSKWVDIIHHNEQSDNTIECIDTLKGQGYSIVATTPDEEAQSIEDFEFTSKTAVFFGTELTGLSDQVLEKCDSRIQIPMKGFTESFNISVSAALCLYILRNKLEKSGLDYKLNPSEKSEIKLEWIKKVVKNSETYIKEFEKSYK